MPYSLVFPPKKARSEGLGDGGAKKWRHPMERTTELFFEAEMVMTQFHMPFHIWLKTVPKEARIFQLAVYRLHLEKENYYNTPKEKRFDYFNRD